MPIDFVPRSNFVLQRPASANCVFLNGLCYHTFSFFFTIWFPDVLASCNLNLPHSTVVVMHVSATTHVNSQTNDGRSFLNSIIWFGP